MPDLIDFFVPGIPQPQGSKTRIHRVMLDDNRARLVPWRTDVIAAAITAMDGRPPITGPVGVSILARFCRPVSHYGTGRNAARLKPSAPVQHTQKPDVDKVARAILDALTIAKVWLDDKQAYDVHARRAWVDRWEVGGAYIYVTSVET